MNARLKKRARTVVVRSVSGKVLSRKKLPYGPMYIDPDAEGCSSATVKFEDSRPWASDFQGSDGEIASEHASADASTSTAPKKTVVVLKDEAYGERLDVHLWV